MHGARFWGRLLTGVAVAVGSVVGAPAIGSGAPAQGPPDAPTTQVTTTVTMSCDGGEPTEFDFVLTVPRSVRAGRAFPLEIASESVPLPDTAAGYVRLSLAGTTVTTATVAAEGTTYLVPAWAPQQDVAITISGFGALDVFQFFDTSCVAEPAALPVTIPVRHETPFAEAQLTAEQRVGLFCLNYPRGWPDASLQTVTLTVPNQVVVGQSFTIAAPADVDVSGGVRSGETVTVTGAVGETVDFSYNGSYSVTAPPPFPPFPVRMCSQRGGSVHLASVPIVAG